MLKQEVGNCGIQRTKLVKQKKPARYGIKELR